MNLLSYPRSLVMAAIYPLYLIFMSTLAVSLNVLLGKKEVDDAIMRIWGKISCAMFGVRVKVLGLENIPKEGCLFVFNHTSFFDIFAMAAVLPGLRFGAKIELFKIPVFGFAMRRMGILPIDRRNREGVFRVYRDAQVRMKSGESFALAPEGTRQDEEKLGPFKAGPFVFAINTQAPIVPVVIRNASKILPKHAWLPNLGTWSREIQLHVLPPIATTGYVVDDRPRLQEIVREKMQPFFEATV